MQGDYKLPCLPGYNFDTNLGRTRFHRDQYFAKIHEGVYYLSEKGDKGDHVSYPSIYPRGETQELPPWIAYDGQRLMFKAFFQETVQERWKTAYQIRVVNISFFLEDGTVKISEPPTNNSGIEQGVLLRRQRIPMPDPVRYRFYDIIDLNIGKEPEIYGRVYKIVDCDKFTRRFLNRMGIPVPDPIDIPKDPYTELQKYESFPKKPNCKIDTRGDFLKYDRQVLRFYGYWDDTDNLFGTVRDLEIHYYLSDNTMEVKENVPPNSGRDSGCMFLRRMKVPKFFSELDPIGSGDPLTVLNVIGDNTSTGYYSIDPLNAGKMRKEIYKDNELSIGAHINIFGRKIVITDMDAFTKEYYRKKYGLDDFTPLERPRKGDEVCMKVQKYIPPYNGFGTYEDSLGNCFTVLPQPPKMDMIKFLYQDKQGFDSNVLRFRAKMISNIPENEDRLFIIRFFLMDDTISIFELARRNSGFRRCLFQKRMPVMLPNQDIFTNSKPDYYKPEDFYIGARINLHEFIFELTSADIYALRYMELHCDKFPQANAKGILGKLRQILKPVYKQFIELYTPAKSDNGLQILSSEQLRKLIRQYADGKITEHEMITIARHYSSDEKKEFHSREYVRQLIHTELSRALWLDLDRLEEDLHHSDRGRTGCLPRDTLYTILRGSRIPADVELINSMLDHLYKNEEGKLDYNDMLRFMNVKIDPVPPTVPINIKTALWWASEKEPDCGAGINWCAFIEDLDIKDENGDPAETPKYVPEPKCITIEP
ncbi:PREDICTED: EF-hand domain-containing family member C2-like [Dufourea novaeangliae]|uniref:EF-hand domain-containing family member C2 n=1 Tax=Dufourea novaeangliae TaxID=178035 RepID=A0A154PE17_DUFNO|nr:PREDICTED: EF-hand domain-containing family member C2-like [Dufourea novaeangliae]KZC10057.1 EF-hand domain-containing family member C2 [Dufourea novaeangliae]